MYYWGRQRTARRVGTQGDIATTMREKIRVYHNAIVIATDHAIVISNTEEGLFISNNRKCIKRDMTD